MNINSELFTDVSKEAQATVSGGTYVNFNLSKLPPDVLKNFFSALTFGFKLDQNQQNTLYSAIETGFGTPT